MNALFSRKMSTTLLLLLLLAVPLQAQPKIHIMEGTKLDFGQIASGSSLKRDVTIKNVGTDTLIINDVVASCGCTATLVDKKILPPNQTSKITITFNSKNFKHEVTKTVTIKSNDPVNSQLAVQFKVKILDILVADPNFIWFSNVIVDSTYTRTITIANESKVPIKILSAKDPANNVQVNVKQTSLPPGEKTQIVATLHPQKEGPLQGSIDIVTDHPQAQKLEVRYLGNTKGK